MPNAARNSGFVSRFGEKQGLEGQVKSCWTLLALSILTYFLSSSPSSSNSPSSSAVASWYCWYSDTKSFMLLSASVNSISSIPSPVYQWRKALRLNIAVNCSEIRLNSSWMAVLLPMKGAHSRPCTTTQGVCELEALKAVTALCLLPHHIQDRVHQLCTLCVVTLCPVVASPTLACKTRIVN
ncbi:hypothetical protein F7725_017492 [Dissostichus mawsoni]|uniref:Uncharacterized protein n=1 Tax=Dissostichus mawsoni TaxID=36200 RepID=A0A7J5Z6M5_DISMA|nr:hypothetical protein F7725_017492 [Dissostichus mawsoni]